MRRSWMTTIATIAAAVSFGSSAAAPAGLAGFDPGRSATFTSRGAANFRGSCCAVTFNTTEIEAH